MIGKASILAIATVLLASANCAVAEDDVTQRLDAARAAASEFGVSLVGELQKAIAAGGTVNAIGVCNVVAPKIAADESAERHMTVGRSSLKLRQPNDAPDASELAPLKRFEERKAAGENPATIKAGEYAERDGKRVFRYMKAIPTGALCLNRHGTSLAPEVAAKLHERYPADAATGFIAGAFTITEAPQRDTPRTGSPEVGCATHRGVLCVIRSPDRKAATNVL